MERDETFKKFYAHFSEIVNSSHNLGRPTDEGKQVEKILASLPFLFPHQDYNIWDLFQT